jgi:hypothetical protein
LGLCWRLWLTPVILVTQKEEIRRTEVRSQPGQIVPKSLSQKNPSQKKSWACDSIAECLPGMFEVLGSIPSTSKKIKHWGDLKSKRAELAGTETVHSGGSRPTAPPGPMLYSA